VRILNQIIILLTLNHKKNPETFNSRLQYSRSKLLNVVFSNELSRKLISKEVYVNSLNPGIVVTNISQNWDLPFSNAVKDQIQNFLKGRIMWDSDVACLTQVGLAVSPAIFQQQIHGQYYVPIFRKWHPIDLALNETVWKLSWESTEKAIKNRGFSW